MSDEEKKLLKDFKNATDKVKFIGELDESDIIILYTCIDYAGRKILDEACKEIQNDTEINEKSSPAISKIPKTIKVSIIDEENKEIWAYGLENGQPCGVSNTTLDFNLIVNIIEFALEQAQGELSIANGELLPADNSD